MTDGGISRSRKHRASAFRIPEGVTNFAPITERMPDWLLFGAIPAYLMRILQIGKFWPPPFGGMETVLRDLVGELAKGAVVDVLVANHENRTTVERLGKRGILVRAASRGTAAGVSMAPGFPALLKRLLRTRAYDAVHVHLPNPLAHGALSLTGYKGKVVLQWHSDIIRQRNLLRLYAPFMKRLLERADAIIAATPKHFASSTQIDAARHGHKCRSIPYGINLAQFDATPEVREAAAALRDGIPGPIVFACGRHIYYKGYEHLIRAMRDVEGATLILGGKGPLTPSLRALAQSCGVADRVRFAGFIPDEDLAAYYHAADVVCMPSVEPTEAYGMVQVEAMACGKPVVCCELGNGVTWVNIHGETGLVVPPRDVPALAVALNTVLGDADLRRRLGTAGRARAEREFTLEGMGERYLRALREICAGA